jgi:hypothetical protein
MSVSYEIVPRKGIGPIMIGMSREEVRSLMNETPRIVQEDA